jgi:catechol 2,3-dioxygenase-like lactoylglutathione lyase family enzyme
VEALRASVQYSRHTMITGVHAMFYSPQAEELRAFFRDRLGLPHLDAGDGWLIFTPSKGEIGFHPGEEVRHDISLFCDDIEATVAELKAKGVEFTQEIEDWGYGRGTYLEAPGGLVVQLYQAHYPH